MRKVLAVTFLFLLFGMAGCKNKKEYVNRFPIHVIEASTETETIESETETVKEEIKEKNITTETEMPTEASTEVSEDFTEEAEEVYTEDTNGSYLGYYELTAYTHTGSRMANGEYPYVGACACNSLDFGTVVYIEGYGTFTVCDRGGMPDNVIDIFMDTYDECVEFGRRGADVYIAE